MLRKISAIKHFIKKQLMKKYGKYVFTLLTVLAVTWYVSTFWYQLMLIQGQSMEPAFHSWQLVVLEKQPEDLCHGDVIAFRCDNLQTVLVKRIVAMPGDTVQVRDGILYVNNSPSEVITTGDGITYAGIAEVELVISEEEYFVLGDNVELSKDSRYSQIGCVQKSDIIGRIL